MPLLHLLVACGAPAVTLDDVSSAPSPDAAVADPAVADPADADFDPPAFVVDCDGGADFTRIGDAIDAAVDGDRIHVRPCTYEESIDFDGKLLTIVGTGGSADTIVEASGGAAVVRAVNGEGPGTTLQGFTLRGGGGRSEPAVYVDFASLAMVDVVLEENAGFTTIYGSSADVELDGVTLRDNRTSYGIAIYMSRGGLVASDIDVTCDGSTGVYMGHGGGLLDRATISCTGGTATHWEHAVGRLQRSVVTGGIYVLAEDDHYDDYVHVTNSVVKGTISAQYGSLDVRNSIVTGGISLTTVYMDTRIEGSVITGATCGVTADTNDFTIRNSIFWDNRANVCGGLLTDPVGTNDNLGENPAFVDARGGDWSLTPGSPGVDAGPDEEGYADVDGSRNDIGVYGGPLSIGGGW